MKKDMIPEKNEYIVLKGNFSQKTHSASMSNMGRSLDFISGFEKILLFGMITIAIAIAGFLWGGSYTKQVTLPGHIIPAEGQVNIYSNFTGYVSKLFVTDRETVDKGQPLYTVTAGIKANGTAKVQHVPNQPEAPGKTMVAPRSGVVSAVSLYEGQRITPEYLTMILLPEEVHWIAELFATGKHIGFLKKGSPVSMRLDAYPFQKFGLYSGHIIDVSRVAVSSETIDYPLDNRENYYRIHVYLNQQCVEIDAACRDFQPGMRLSASVASEKRSLIGWLMP